MTSLYDPDRYAFPDKRIPQELRTDIIARNAVLVWKYFSNSSIEQLVSNLNAIPESDIISARDNSKPDKTTIIYESWYPYAGFVKLDEYFLFNDQIFLWKSVNEFGKFTIHNPKI